MTNKYLLLFIFLTSALFAQKKTEEFDSAKLKAKRNITILTPPSYETKKDKKYPLLVLLDGEYLMDPFAGTLSYTNYWDDLPEVIIVAIDQNDKNQRQTDSQWGKESGLPEDRGENFFEFIGMELLPYMEKKYRIAPFKIIAGHDLTAGYMNFFLYKDIPLFNAYICLSPELPTNMETILPGRLTEIKKPIFFYLATADGDVTKLQKKIKVLNDGIKLTKNQGLRYRFDDFGGASHYSLVTYAIPSALYHIFSSYQPISTTEYMAKLVTLPSGYVDYLEKKYQVIEKDLGTKMTIRLNDFKAVESAILKNEAYNELQDLAALAKKSYPKMIIGEYYSALYYEKKGDNKRAIKTYLNSYVFGEIGDYTKDFMMLKAEGLKSTE